ncbi:MAG: hypothetical protein ACOX3E_04180 [Desulfomonilia bacterium]|jgi:hypothetical protein|uniref:Uncharacterized protein n=1 Tax=anaerobic digester metagenome TaxID=1263854 RepID=A0A485M4T1_9ZZZZ|nr:hypothetical protein [Pseudomonadota bacterium]HON38090.1 hypothetical protein [Deltaproteobacteria bacterium]HRS56264.1 hypothetical protein [Desulfomonilia bacterium]HPD21700.1 hypothetical protein [Deltaproteobacteria bacterium]HPX18987.1 hypothetical protein [Deltaproteobacteria bacterium]
MGKNERELHYLQMIVDFYMDHEDKNIVALLMRISESLERMRACA